MHTQKHRVCLICTHGSMGHCAYTSTCMCVCVYVCVCAHVYSMQSCPIKLFLHILLTMNMTNGTHKTQLTREKRRLGWRQQGVAVLPEELAGRKKLDWCDSVAWCCTPGQHTTVSTRQSVLSNDVVHLVNTLLCQHVSLFHHMILHTWSSHYCVKMSVCFITWCCTPGQHTTVSTCQSVLSHDVAHLVNTLLCQHVSVLSHDGVHLVNTLLYPHVCLQCHMILNSWSGKFSKMQQFTNKDYTLSKLPYFTHPVPCQSCHIYPQTQYPVKVAMLTCKESTLSKLPHFTLTVSCQSSHTSPTNTVPYQSCHTSPTNTIPYQSCHTVPCWSWSTTSGDTLHPQTQYLVKVGSVLCGNTLHPQTQYLVTQYLVKVGVHQVVTHVTHKHSTLSKLSASSGDTLHPQTQYLVKVGVHQVLAALALCHRGLLVSVPPSHAEDDQGRWLLLQLLQCWHSSIGSHLGAHLLHTCQDWAQESDTFTHTYHSCLLTTLWMRTNRLASSWSLPPTEIHRDWAQIHFTHTYHSCLLTTLWMRTNRLASSWSLPPTEIHRDWAQIHFTHTYHSCLLTTLWMRTNRLASSWSLPPTEIHRDWAQIHFTHTYHSCLLTTLWMRTNRLASSWSLPPTEIHRDWAQIHFTHTYHSCLLTTLWMRTNRLASSWSLPPTEIHRDWAQIHFTHTYHSCLLTTLWMRTNRQTTSWSLPPTKMCQEWVQTHFGHIYQRCLQSSDLKQLFPKRTLQSTACKRTNWPLLDSAHATTKPPKQSLSFTVDCGDWTCWAWPQWTSDYTGQVNRPGQMNTDRWIHWISEHIRQVTTLSDKWSLFISPDFIRQHGSSCMNRIRTPLRRLNFKTCPGLSTDNCFQSKTKGWDRNTLVVKTH